MLIIVSSEVDDIILHMPGHQLSGEVNTIQSIMDMQLHMQLSDEVETIVSCEKCLLSDEVAIILSPTHLRQLREDIKMASMAILVP